MNPQVSSAQKFEMIAWGETELLNPMFPQTAQIGLTEKKSKVSSEFKPCPVAQGNYFIRLGRK